MKNAFFTDFPSWLPSALVKELRQGLRTSSFILMVSVLPAAMSLFFLFGFIPDAIGNPIVSQKDITTVFWIFLFITLIVCTPFRALSAIREELVSRNSELLLLTRQTSGRIILGKWTSFMAQALLMVFIALPFALIRYYYGQIDLVEDITLIACLYLACGVMTAFSLWISALPSLLRVILIAGLFFAVSSLLNFNFIRWGLNINLFHDGFWLGLFKSAIILADYALVISTILILARRWFAPAAENTAYPLRRILLFFYVGSLAIMYAVGDSSSPIENIMTVHTFFLMIYSIFLMVVDLATPSVLLPVHVEQLRKKKLFGITKFLFLPGMPGSVFFTLLMAVFWSLSVNAIDQTMAHRQEMFQTPLFLACLAVAAWYALSMPAILLKPFWGRLKNNTLLAYVLTWLFIAFLLMLKESGELFIPTIVPGGDFLQLMESVDKASSHAPLNTLFCVINLMAALIVLTVTNAEWFQTLKTAKANHHGNRVATPGPEHP